MTEHIQLVGGSKTNQDGYTGLPRELTVDTSNNDLRLHDGTTPGGHIIQSRDNADSRYQGKSAELTAIQDFQPLARGFLVRRAGGDYVLRSIQVNEENLLINYPSGYSGDPYISLSPLIASDHTFSGQIIFETYQAVFNGGIQGDVEGNVLGNLMGDVVGNVTGNLTGDSTGIHTGDSIGGLDARGATVLFDADQIPIGAINGLDDFLTANGTFIGMIVMWGGAASAIPAGWKLCDGTNGTPDLRDRFILGAGGSAEVGDVGGDLTHSHDITIDSAGAHAHTVNVGDHALTTSEIPSHKHGNGVTDNSTVAFNHGTIGASPTTGSSMTANGSRGIYEGFTTNVGDGAAHGHSASSDSAGAHSHIATIADGPTIPPYYALCFIMKGA